MTKNEVIVIGGGIVGLSCALELAKKGLAVTILEQNQIGKGCSFANAGWLTPCFALPLPAPGMLFKSIGWLLDSKSPLHIQPQLSWDLLRWLLQFTLSMRGSKFHAGAEALVSLSQLSLEQYQLIAQEFPQVHLRQKGLLMLSAESQGVQAAQDELDLVTSFGVLGRGLNVDEIYHMEPALKKNIRGGVYFPNEASIEPYLLSMCLLVKCRKLGVQVFENSEVIELAQDKTQIKKLKTKDRDFSADIYVLATGSWSKNIARQLKVRAPILGGKGYSMQVDKASLDLRHPTMIIEKKIALTPRQDSTRVAGTLELVDQNFEISQKRVELIQNGVESYFEMNSVSYKNIWAGLRPCTPDGLPMIGKLRKFENLFFACGHQMLGLQSGIGTGILISDLVVEGKSDHDRRVFDPNRF